MTPKRRNIPIATDSEDASKPKFKRIISERELQDRNLDFENAIKLYESVSDSLNKIRPVIEKSLSNMNQLNKECSHNLVLRTAMLPQVLHFQKVLRDVEGIVSRVRLTEWLIKKSIHQHKDELERVIQDPELLR